MADPRQPAWLPDPMGRYDHRWWDGEKWTDNVSQAGSSVVDPLGTLDGNVPTAPDTPERIQRQVRGQAGMADAVEPGGGTLFTEPVLVVNQKAKLIEVNNEYAVYDGNGTQLGAIRQVGQSTLKKLLRVVADVDQFLTHRLELVDNTGAVQLRVTRPAKFVRSKVIVETPDGREVGQLVQQNAIGKIRFDLVAGGGSVGSLHAENWRAWDFAIKDAMGVEVARIKKTFEGIAKTMFTTADNYVIRIHRPLDDPLRSLVVAAAVSIDTALKQDSRGFN